MQQPLMQNMTLDARRLLCPLPVIRVQKAIQQLQTDDTLTVLATDPGCAL
jgi:TusA-related sulfurtransferase